MSDTTERNNYGPDFTGLTTDEVVDIIVKEGFRFNAIRQIEQGGFWYAVLVKGREHDTQHFSPATSTTMRDAIERAYNSVRLARRMGTIDHSRPSSAEHGALAGDYEQVQRPVVERVRERQRVTTEQEKEKLQQGAVLEAAPVVTEVRERVRLQPVASVDVSPPPAPAVPQVIRQRARPA